VLRARLAAGLLVSVAVAVGLLAAPAWAVPLPAGRQPPPGVTISAVGDTMLGNTPTLPVHPAHYLDKVRGSLDKAQIVFGNLEGTLTTATDSKCDSGSTNCFAFRVPPRYAGYLRYQGVRRASATSWTSPPPPPGSSARPARTRTPLHDSSRKGAHLVARLSNEDFGAHAARVLRDGTIELPQ